MLIAPKTSLQTQISQCHDFPHLTFHPSSLPQSLFSSSLFFPAAQTSTLEFILSYIPLSPLLHKHQQILLALPPKYTQNPSYPLSLYHPRVRHHLDPGSLFIKLLQSIGIFLHDLDQVKTLPDVFSKSLPLTLTCCPALPVSLCSGRSGLFLGCKQFVLPQVCVLDPFMFFLNIFTKIISLSERPPWARACEVTSPPFGALVSLFCFVFLHCTYDHSAFYLSICLFVVIIPPPEYKLSEVRGHFCCLLLNPSPWH